MLILPWYVRFGVDCALVALPFYYLHSKAMCHYA